MDRFRARSLSRRTHLHLLGLFPSALAEGFGIAHRSSVAQCRPGAAPPQCRRRSLGPRPAPCKRPRADLDRVGYAREEETRVMEARSAVCPLEMILCNIPEFGVPAARLQKFRARSSNGT